MALLQIPELANMTEATNNDALLLDLNFVPAWARRPADQNPYSAFEGRGEARRDRDRFAQAGSGRKRAGTPGRDGPPGRRRTLGKQTGPAPASRATPRGARPDNFNRGRPDFRSQPDELPLAVSFLPERRGLQPLARLFAKTARAYSLMEVAAMFLSRPEFHAVKLEVLAADNRPAPGKLYQCKECQAVFMSREQAVFHGLAKHADLFFEREEIQAEPPKGKFACVAKCGLSGVLLGPPNYHEFNERLLELHRTRFAAMPLDEYRNKITNDSDPAAIEQWKQEVCRQVTYRTRSTNGEPQQVFKRHSEMEAHFRERLAPGLIREGQRFIIPGPASRQMDDSPILRAIQRAWSRESRFPLKIAIALHPAFRSYGLHLFKTPDRTTFVTAIPPHPLDPSQMLEDVIRRILDHLVAHPGSARSELVASLFPGTAADAPPVAELVNRLRWLIDKGHIIEFSNGKLAVPYRQPPAAPRKENEASPGAASVATVKSRQEPLKPEHGTPQ